MVPFYEKRALSISHISIIRALRRLFAKIRNIYIATQSSAILNCGALPQWGLLHRMSWDGTIEVYWAVVLDEISMYFASYRVC